MPGLLPGVLTDNIMELLGDELKDPTDVLSTDTTEQMKSTEDSNKNSLDEILPTLPPPTEDQGLAQIDSKALEELLSATGEVLSVNAAPEPNNSFPLPPIPSQSPVSTGPAHTVNFGPSSQGARSDGSLGEYYYMSSNKQA